MGKRRKKRMVFGKVMKWATLQSFEGPVPGRDQLGSQ